jgi:DNA-binding transcriptional regulator YhcF (GntR family)
LLDFAARVRPPYRTEAQKVKRISAPPELGAQANHRPGQWVQTERKAHEAWANLIARKPRAAALAHILVANMHHQNAVVAPQTVLAKLMGCSVDTVQRAIRDLVAEQWIQVVRLGKGKEAAYVVNDRVAWGQPRDQLRLSTFSATVVADIEDQDAYTLDAANLRRIPTLYPGERQLPTGPGEDPPSQPSIEGMEPDLPALQGDAADRAELEKRGQKRLTED